MDKQAQILTLYKGKKKEPKLTRQEIAEQLSLSFEEVCQTLCEMGLTNSKKNQVVAKRKKKRAAFYYCRCKNKENE